MTAITPSGDARARPLSAALRELGTVPGRLGRQLAGLLGRPPAPVFRPRFDDEWLLARLGPDFDANDPAPEVSQAFRERPTPVFFFDPARPGRLREDYRDADPRWRDATLENAHTWLNDSYAVYGRPGPPLARAPFPWGNVPPGPGEDRLYCQRPHRFGFFAQIAKAAWLEQRAAPEIPDLLDDWRRYAAATDNRLAYARNPIVVQRVLACTWGWYFLAARVRSGVRVEAEAFAREETEVLKQIASDVAYLETFPGRSYALHHRLTERFAQWFLALVWPEFCAPGSSLAAREEAWLRELKRQLYADGGHVEHSTHYHSHVCEMLCCFLLLGERNGRPVPAWVEDLAERALRLQSDLAGAHANAVSIGDGTGDPLLALAGDTADTGATWREIGRHRFGWRVAATSGQAAPCEKAFWLLGAHPPGPQSAREYTPLRGYPQSGLYVFEQPGGSARLVLRTGPAPDTEVSAGHMHADWLALYAEVGGHPLIVPSGTYTYRRDTAGPTSPDDAIRRVSLREDGGTVNWRRYFMGPAAANSVHYPGHDPLGRVEGDFRDAWLNGHVSARAPAAAPGFAWVEGRIAGTECQEGQTRGVAQVGEQYWVIYDLLPGERSAAARLQIDPGIRVEPLDRYAVRLLGDGVDAALYTAGWGHVGVLNGDTETPAGWVSTAYGQVQAAPQLALTSAAGQREAVMVLAPRHFGRPAVEATRHGAHLEVAVRWGDALDTLLVALDETVSEFASPELRFRGRALWLRRGRDLSAMRWLQGESFAAPWAELEARGVSPWLELETRHEAPLVRHDPAVRVAVRTPPGE